MKILSGKSGLKIAMAIPTVALMAFLAGCQGSSLTSSTSNPGPLTRAVVAVGPVSQIGTGNSGQSTLIVNGKTYLVTTSTQITVNRKAATITSIQSGNIVVVRSTAPANSTADTAESVESDAELEGPISAINITGGSSGTVTVLDQTVVINSATLFDSAIPGQSISGLTVNEPIEVSGLIQSGGSILATRIDTGVANEYQVTGIVGNENSGSSTFNIGSLVVDYSTAGIIQNFPSGAPQNGNVVQVQGTTLDSSGALVASELVNQSNSVGDNSQTGDDGSIDGIIDNFVSATDFHVGGQAVTTTPTTSYENGTVADLANNVEVEVEGQVNSSGTLVAQTIQFQSQPTIEIAAPADAVDVGASTLTVLGLTIQVTASTRMTDDSSNDSPTFTLGDLNPGDYVDISGTESSSGQIVAATLQRENAQSSDMIGAIVESVANPNFTLLGITVITNSSTQFMGVSAATFFSTALGKRVQVTGTMSSGSFTATQVEFDN